MEGDVFLERMRKGDVTVWDELMPSIRTICFGTCSRLGIYDEMRNDVVQEVAVKVFTNWQSYREEAKLSYWISNIARNYCLDELRKVKRRNEQVSYEQDDEESPLMAIPDNTASNMIQKLCVEQVIAELENQAPARKGSMRTIDVLRWCIENSPSSEELADFLKASSASAAKERKSYMLKQIRALCEKFCGNDRCAFNKHGA